MNRLDNVNTTDILDAIQLGCKCMSNIFNADDNNIPYFTSSVWPKAALGFHIYHSESHVPGRHLNAMLNAEDVSGKKISDEVIENHRQAAKLSYSGALPLPFNRVELSGNPISFCPHNIREGFHALYSLAKYRNDSWATEMAEESIKCILELWKPETGWNVDLLQSKGILYLSSMSFIHGEGRMLGSLVKYYKVTHSQAAMKLIHLLSDKMTTEFFTADGRFSSELFGTHSHSVTCCMSSLAQLAEFLNDASLVQHVKAFYDNGLWAMRDEIGWSPESTEQPLKKESDHGEGNNTGDILETALILGKLGYDEYYDDAERILRAHLLPSQLRDVSFIKDQENSKDLDCFKNMAERHKGAWGFPAPYGHKSIKSGRGAISFNMDIVGGVTGSLCEAYRNIVNNSEFGLNVNLLFDYKSADICIKSPYTNDCLSIMLHKPSTLNVKIPKWADRNAIVVNANGGEHFYSGNRLILTAPKLDEEIKIHIPLTESTLTLLRNHIQPIRIRFKGDSVIAMENHEADFTFFAPF